LGVGFAFVASQYRLEVGGSGRHETAGLAGS